METKPYRIQSPEDIAKDYGGNKQKIAQAMQMGVVDPTAGVLAGMFIDRMRSAQVQEMAPQPSVAQQVMGGVPQAPGAVPPGGLGMTPPAPPPMAPGIGAPPMGDMPMGAPPMGAPPAPPMGMADGGLTTLPIPETMFDEPMDGSYADGGIVSFREAGLTSTPDYSVLRQMMADYGNVDKGREQYEAMYQPKREAADRFRQFYGDALSEEGQKKRSKQDLNSFLMEFGAKLASTRGPLLSAAGEAAGQTLPGYQESVKERRAEQRDALKQLALDEGASNAEARDIGKMVMDGRLKASDIGQTIAKMRSQETLTREELKSRERTSAADNAARIQAALIGAANGDGGKDSMRPTYSGSVELSGKQRTDVEDALKEMIKAEEKGDYARFKAAGSMYSTALRNYNQTLVGKLG